MKGKKLLAGILSAAMVFGTMAMPAFADDPVSEMTFKEFIEKANAGVDNDNNVTFDGSYYTQNGDNLKVVLKAVSTCGYGGQNDECTNDCTNAEGLAEYYCSRIDADMAMYVIFGGKNDVEIKNVDFSYEGGYFTSHYNSGYSHALFPTAVNPEYAQIQISGNEGDIEFDNCGFDGVALNFWHNDDIGKNIKTTINECAFKNIEDNGAIRWINTNESVITNNEFTNVESAIMFTPTESCIPKVTITGNTFDGMTGNLIKLDGDASYENAVITIKDNVAENLGDEVYVLKASEEIIKSVKNSENYSDNSWDGADEFYPYVSGISGNFAVIGQDRIYGDVTALINRSLKVELWTKTECIATTELKDGDQGFGDMIDGTEKTVTFGFNYDANSDLGSDYWTGNHFAPTIEKRPEKVVVYVDGEEMCEVPVAVKTETDIAVNDFKWNELSFVYAPAKIGNVGYESLEAALAAAKDGDEITMYENATVAQNDFKYLYPGYNFTNAAALDLNGHKLVLNGCDYKISSGQSGKNFTFTSSAKESGIIEITTEVITGTGIFWILGNQKIKFENVEIDAKNFSSTGYAGWAVVDLEGSNSDVEFVNSKLNVGSDEMIDLSHVISCNGSNQNIVFDNSVLDVKNIGGKAIGNGNVTVKGDKSEIKVDNAAIGLYFGTPTSGLTVTDDAHINITNIFGDDEWNPEKAGIVLGATNSYSFEKPENIKATVYRTPSNNNLANTVKVSFADVTAENAEGEKVYDIYVEADSDKTINRLTAVQMALNLSTTDDFEMTVTAADGVTRSFEKGMYLFNFDGETKPSATGTKIKLGQVKLVGYGKFTLAIDETEENKAHATTNEGENLVTDFIPNAGEGQGTFDISASLTDTVKKATRNLTINIDFNHAVENHAAAYQDMTVTVTGPDAYEKVIELGSDKTEIVDNKVTIEIKDELVLNTQYNVEVKGAGYRTVNHPVNMNADKTLNFWNNYKNTAVNVEENNDATAKNTTFLAGELVKDGKINIYDLSAVVSYFGTSNDVKAESDYAKYDLDRNGKIDSKDVAYVLVSWGK